MKKAATIEFPANWDELTAQDYEAVLQIREQAFAHAGQFTVKDVFNETAQRLLDLRGVKRRLTDARYLLLVHQLSLTLDWLWQCDDGGHLMLRYDTTENLVPRAGDLIGPQSHGADLTFGEFRQAFTLLKAIEAQSEPNLDIVAQLAGLLYRPAATVRQQREEQLLRRPYDWDTARQQLERGYQMAPWQQWAAYAWFAHFCEYLTTGSFVIEGTEVYFAPIFTASDRSEEAGKSGSLSQICLTLAESHVFGTVRDVNHTLLLTVMQKLLMDYEKLQEMKKAYKK